VEVSVLLDSVIVIDHLNGRRAATAYLRSVQDARISVITRAEVLAGIGGESLGPVRRLLDLYPTLPIDAETADVAADLRRQNRWKLPDAFQAALAQRHDLKLATRNTRDFPPAKHSFVVVPYELPAVKKSPARKT
jgi:predicted nucleic acid-binding protein